MIACALFSSQLSAFAQSVVPADGQNPDQVEQLGVSTQYVVTGTVPGRPVSVGWSGRQSDTVTPQGFGPNGQGGKYNFGNPGQYEIQAVIHYPKVSSPSDMPPPDQTVIYKVTIPPPTVDKIIGPGQPAPLAPTTATLPPPANAQPTGPNAVGGIPGQWEYFVLKSKGKTIGPQLSSWGAQEKITQFYYAGVKQDDGVWRPNNPNATDKRDQGSDSSFGIIQLPDNNFAIADFKCLKPPYPNFKGNLVIYKQENRVYWIDNSGALVQGPSFGTKIWQFDGNGDGTWTATVTDPPPTP